MNVKKKELNKAKIYMLQLIGMETSLICLDFMVVRLKEPRGERAESVSRTW